MVTGLLSMSGRFKYLYLLGFDGILREDATYLEVVNKDMATTINLR